MSFAALAAVLVPGLGIALSPVPVEAVIAMLRTAAGRSLGLLFAAAYAGGIALLAYVALLLASVGDYAGGSTTYQRVGALQVVLGVGLWVLAGQRWRLKAPVGSPATPPAWLEEADHFTALRTIGVAVPLATASPKNVVLALVAMIAGSELPDGAGGVYVGFVVLSCLAVALPVVVDLPAPDRARPVLDGWRRWLADHNDAIAIASLVLLGAFVVTRGFEALAR